MTRAKNLQIWQFIAEGILRDGELSFEQEVALKFIEQVALDILAADQSNPNQRAELIKDAVGLGGRLDPKEQEKREAVEIVNDFFSELSEREQVKIMLGFYRENLGLPGNLDQATDEERLRQIKAYRKKKADRK
jgi:hypothetical protein